MAWRFYRLAVGYGFEVIVVRDLRKSYGQRGLPILSLSRWLWL
ncbi:hypothetical protein [Pseudolactococcus hodotermopsidis]|nr:hypothetical protein [Lactococcus hodotermopsidis]